MTDPRDESPEDVTTRETSTETEQPPVFFIRDAAAQSGTTPTFGFDNVSNLTTSRILRPDDANQLITLFRTHYGRWICVDETASKQALSSRARQSPLLLHSICLIAVRHTTEQYASITAPLLFQETQSLVGQALLHVAENLDVFASLLILSLWSTTVGQTPLGVDGWLLTSYGLHQAQVCSAFDEVFRHHPRKTPLAQDSTDAWCIWNHLCLAHLQYCVGTRRVAVLDERKIQICGGLLQRVEEGRLSNFEVRMIAEVKLYWLIYKQSLGMTSEAQTMSNFEAWKGEWAELFDEPRTQFLQMGYYFAILLIQNQSARRGKKQLSQTSLEEIIRLITSILHLAINSADERSQHLTDHIYHIITFSTLMLCRLLHKYEERLKRSHNLESLHSLVTKTVEWMQSIGLSCHVAHMLARTIEEQHERTHSEQTGSRSEERQPDHASVLPTSSFPEYITAEMFDFGMDDTWSTSWDGTT